MINNISYAHVSGYLRKVLLKFKSEQFLSYCDMTPEGQNSPLLDNVSVNIFSRLRSQQWDLRCLVAGWYVS
jgi:hypothetical protein